MRTLAPLFALLAAASLAGCLESAERLISYESAIEVVGVVDVETLNGEIRLSRDPSTTRVRGTIRVIASGFDDKSKARNAAAAVRIDDEGDAQRLDITALIPVGADPNDFEIHMDLRVPDGVTVAALTNDAPIIVDGLGVGALDTSNGPIDLRFTSGDARLRTNDAPVVVDGHEGPLDIRTTFAPIDLFGVAGDVRATTLDGFIVCRALPPRNAEIVLSTTNGGVDLSVPFDFDADLVATTTGPFNIFVDNLDFFPLFEAPGQLEGELGVGGFGLVDIRTTNADIVVQSRR